MSVGGSRRRARWDGMLCATFALAIVMPLAAMIARGASPTILEAENRMTAPKPEAPSDLSSLLTFPGRFDGWWNDVFGGREELVRWHNALGLFVLHTTPNPAYFLGDEGWIFYTGDDSRRCWRGDPMDPFCTCDSGCTTVPERASCDGTGGSMPEEFEGDLAGAVFWGADLSGARFRDVNLTDAKISHAWLVNVDIDALVDTVVINGVDVTDYVNERDPWYPLRAMLRPSNPDDMRADVGGARGRVGEDGHPGDSLCPKTRCIESVNDEWSFVQTLRHLVFAMDKWFTVPILGGAFHPIGLPNSGSVDFPWPGLDYEPRRRRRRRRSRCAPIGRRACATTSRSIATADFAATGRRARERHEPAAGVHLHRLRGRVLAQPLRACATCAHAGGSQIRPGSYVSASRMRVC